MVFKTGSWGIQAKLRSKRRLEYFKKYEGTRISRRIGHGIPLHIVNEIKNTRAMTCSMCSSDKKLLIHHKDHDKKNNLLCNLQILCRGCHNKVHDRRGGIIRWLKEKQQRRVK